MHALRDRNQGISRAVEPLPGTTGSAEAAGLAKRPDYCKRLFLPRADSDADSFAYVTGAMVLSPVGAENLCH